METLRRAGRSALALLLTRVEFAGVELSLAREQAQRWFLVALAAGVLGLLGLASLSAMIVLALWDRFGWYSAATLAVVYCGGAIMLAARLLHRLASAPPLLSQTLSELARDLDALRGAALPRPDEDRAP